jgi:hypothetical protein
MALPDEARTFSEGVAIRPFDDIERIAAAVRQFAPIRRDSAAGGSVRIL